MFLTGLYCLVYMRIIKNSFQQVWVDRMLIVN